MNAARPRPASARWPPPPERAARARRRRAARRPAAPGSSCAAAPAASARPPPPRRWRCGPPSAAARSSCSPSTRPAGSRSRWASSSSTTPRGRCRASTRPQGGALDAMMLDMKRTFDEVVESQASPEKAQADPGEPLLHRAVELVRGHAGVHGDGEARPDPRRGRRRDGTYDLIVVDTPPSRSALDFLDAPERLSSFLDGRFIRLLLAPAKGPARLMTAGFGAGHQRADQDPRRPGAARPADVRGRASTPSSAASASAPSRPSSCCRPTGRRSWWSPRPSRTRCARRRTSSSGSTEDEMPLAGLVVNRASPAPRRHAVRRRGDGRAPSGCASATPESLDRRAAAAARRPDAAWSSARRTLRERFAAAHPQVPTAVVPALAARRARPRRPAPGRRRCWPARELTPVRRSATGDSARRLRR